MNLEGILADNRYRILQFIGEGGMSRVYKAEDIGNNTLAALKFMKERVASSFTGDVIRFKKELEIASRLKHPGIAGIYGSGEHNGMLFIAMELLEGKSLDQYIRQNSGFDPDEAVNIVFKLAEILDYIHGSGIIHKDIKPGNFFVTESRGNLQFKLLDFGVAHIMELGEIQGGEEIAGTFGYMSPEATGLLNENIDERSDLYSLGVIFYQLLTGELPFKAREVGRLLHQQAASVPVRPVTINKEIPAVLGDISMKLLMKDPDSRYQSVKGLLYDLERYRRGDREFAAGGVDQKVKLTYRTRLLGREDEAGKIAGLIGRALEGKGGLCLIGGEAGVGKSRLVEEFRGYAYSRDMMFLGARCLNHTNKTPYQPFRDLLDDYIGMIEKSDRKTRERELLKLKNTGAGLNEILVRLNPRIKRFIGETKELAALEPERESQRFLSVLSDFFCGISAQTKVCIFVLDDLQWMDVGSMSLLREIAAKAGGSCLLVLGVYRDNELGEGHGICDLIKESKLRDYPLEEIKLGKLDYEAVKGLTARILGEKEESIGDLSGYIYEKSGGNPLFTINILRELIENGIVVRKDTGWHTETEGLSRLPVPEGMLNIIMSRIGRLDGQYAKLLCKAAIIGREFDLALLCHLADHDYEKLVEMIDNAISMQLLEKGAVKGRLLFAHDRIRDVFFFKPEEAERRKIHLEIAGTIERLNEDGIEKAVFELAHHYIEARESNKILEYALPAADKAKQSYANEDAVRLYNIALGLVADDRERIRINERLIEIYLMIGRYDDAIRISEGLLPLLGASMGRAGMLKKIGIAYFKKGDWGKCEKYIAEGMRLLGEKVPIRKVQVAVSLSVQLAVHLAHCLISPGLYKRGRLKEPVEKKEILSMYYTLNWMYGLSDVFKLLYSSIRSLNLSESMAVESRELGASLSLYAGVCMSVPLFGRSLRFHRKALNIRRKLGDEWGEAQSLQFIGYNNVWKGNYSESQKCFEESQRIFSKIGDAWEAGLSFAGIMMISLYDGSCAKGISSSRKHFEQCRTMNDLYGMNIARQVWAYCLAETGEYGEAEQLLASVSVSTRENDLLFLFCITLSYQGFLYLEQGRYDAAVENLTLAREHYLKNSFLKDPLLQIFPQLAEAYIKKLKELSSERGAAPSRKEWTKAWLLCREALKRTRHWPNHYGGSLRSAAILHALAGRKAKAERLFLKSIKITSNIGREYEAAKGYFEYGLFLEAAGRHDEAGGSFLKAFELFSRTGAKEYARRCRSLLPEAAINEKRTGELAARERFISDRRMNAVLNAGRYISSILNLDELLEKIMYGVAELIGAERGVLLLYPEEGEKKLQARVLHNMPEAGKRGYGHTVSMSIIAKVEEEKIPLLISDALSEEHFRNSSSVVSGAIKSVICVPVTVKGELLGIIYLDNNLINGLFSGDDLNIVSNLAGQAGVSIQNARMYTKLKDYLEEITRSREEIAQWNRELERRVQERTEELNSRNAELAAAIAQLEESADMVEELAVAKERNRFALDAHDHLGHTLTLLIKLLEVSRMTSLDTPEIMDNKLEEAVRIARGGLEELRASVRGLASGKIKGEKLSDALEELARDFAALGIHVELSVKGLQDLTEPLLYNTLRALCVEASTNALKHGRAKNISIIAKDENGHIRLVIFDDGCGCKDINKGFGLTGMENRVLALNGNIVFNSDGENGFIIHADIPYGGKQHI